MSRPLRAALYVLLLLPATAVADVKEEELDGYAEYRQGGVLIVDGQKLATGAATKWKGGKNQPKDIAAIPLGFEVKAKGMRGADGVIVAREIEAKPNGKAMFEAEALQLTSQMEQQWLARGLVYQEGAGGQIAVTGRLHESGAKVARVRSVVESLLPPYKDPADFRVYVVDNEDWNAFACANGMIVVHSSLLDDMDDDELALILGHEIAHATHEHTRKQFKKAMWIQIAAIGVAAASETVDNKNVETVMKLLAVFGASAWKNGYGRGHEDQADRVGMRYAYEAGYDISKGPRLWNRFAKKYGEQGKVANFFFGDHSLSSARAKKLETELALNYADFRPDPSRRAAHTRSRPEALPALAPAPPAPVQALTPPKPAVKPAGAAAVAAPAAPAAAGTRREIKAGMTTDEVRAILGKPQAELAFENKTRWSYPDLTVIFENGRVKEVRF